LSFAVNAKVSIRLRVCAYMPGYATQRLRKISLAKRKLREAESMTRGWVSRRKPKTVRYDVDHISSKCFARAARYCGSQENLRDKFCHFAL